MENRHRDALRRILDADERLRGEGQEPEEFLLVHAGGMSRDILHPRWDQSWAAPSEHTIDDLAELNVLRVYSAEGKARKFGLTFDGRERAKSLLADATQGRNEAESASPPETIPSSPPTEPSEGNRKVAVMHGRDPAARSAVFDLLRRLGLEPLEWDDLVDLTNNAAPYNGEAVAAAFRVAQAVVVVLTPDDVGFLHPALHGPREVEDDRKPTGQPRLNVVLEAGMSLQSHPTRTVLVEIGRTRAISDLAGRNTIRLDGTPAKFNSFANRLERAKCPVDRTGSDWLEGAVFRELDAQSRTPEGLDGASEPTTSPLRREIRHLGVELETIDRTVESALRNEHWWNVRVEGLPAEQWAATRDALAEESPDLYDAVSPIYVEADQLNKAANNQAQGGHDSYDQATREQLERVREAIQDARDLIRRHLRSEAGGEPVAEASPSERVVSPAADDAPAALRVSDAHDTGPFNLPQGRGLNSWLLNDGPASIVLDRAVLHYGSERLRGSLVTKGDEPVQELTVGVGEECCVQFPDGEMLARLRNDRRSAPEIDVRFRALRREGAWWQTFRLRRTLDTGSRAQWIAAAVSSPRLIEASSENEQHRQP